MAHEGEPNDPGVQENSRFTTTHWTTVLRAGRNDSARSAQALEKLCRAYWYPLYTFVRRQGQSEEAAKDLTQAFFARLLEKNYLSQADRERGRFRSFLLTALKHFLADEWDKASALKRGGGQPILSLDDSLAEERYRLEPVDNETPEIIFERRWALTVMEQAAARLEEEYVVSGKGELHARLKRFQTGELGEVSLAEAAAQLGMPENTLKSHLHRLRLRNRELLREVIADTVASPQEVDAEIQHMMSVLSG